MAVKIRLRRVGKVHVPYYRIIVTDSRSKRDGRFIEQIGKYHPKEDPSFIEVNSERAQYWLGVGAQPSEPVRAILRRTGDWQQFKGEPAPDPLQVPQVKRSQDELFNEALKEAGGAPKEDEAKPRKSRKKSEAKADEAKADDAKADDAKADEAKPAEAESASDTATSEAGATEAEAGDDATKG